MSKNYNFVQPIIVLFFGVFFSTMNAQMVHPGLSHKQSDLDRMKYQVQARIEPYYSSYQLLLSDARSGYDYEVRGDGTVTDVSSDFGAVTNDARAAYNNALLWYITEDTRYAEKAVAIFNAWTQITNVSNFALEAGKIYHMIEGAEIIKHTYNGWSAADQNEFEAMLVYPGYSNTKAPSSSNQSFYWRMYQGDPFRHGNQGISGMRALLAIGVFLDNEIMYDRALRYCTGLSHRADDLPYPSGPNTSTSIASSTIYADNYNVSTGNSIEDYGYNELMIHYIYENGQCQESSRDQDHVFFGVGSLASMAEIAWSQNDDLYGFENDRLLTGYEFAMKYNLSSKASYTDQTSPWEPTVASGEFLEGFDRTGRWYSKAISPDGRGDFPNKRPILEMAIGHYLGRGFRTEEEVKWTLRSRDFANQDSGYERAGWTSDHLGFGGLTCRRPNFCFGDPISGLSTDGLPNFAMHVIPTSIEAENYDYSPVLGQDRTYNDTSNGNSGNEYRTNENVDIEVCSEGGFNVASIDSGEWLTYTIYVPETGTYNIDVRYAAVSSNGKIKLSIAGEDKTGEVRVSETGGAQIWQTATVKEGVLLSKGVQSLKISFSGAKNTINLNSFSISKSSACAASSALATANLSSGIGYDYYEGTWNAIPDYRTQTIVASGVTSSIGLGNGERDDSFGYRFYGYINILLEGDYTFYTTSDDGSNLFIDDVKIVDNDGTHGAEEKSGNICLAEGYHKIEVSYFEKSGSNDVLEVAYDGPNLAKQLIDNLYTNPETLDVPTFELFDSNNQNSLSVFPNPVIDFLNISVEKNDWDTNNLVFTLYTLSGRKLFETQNTEIIEGIAMTGFASGIFLLEVSDNHKKLIKKIIK